MTEEAIFRVRRSGTSSLSSIIYHIEQPPVRASPAIRPDTHWINSTSLWIDFGLIYLGCQ